MKIKDSLGITHCSINRACKHYGIARSNLMEQFARKGTATVRGIEFTKISEEDEEGYFPTEHKPQECVLRQDFAKRLSERYSEHELMALANGEGLKDREIDKPKITLSGKHHRYMVISDGHIGSKYSPEEWHIEAFKEAERKNCDGILHCGDVFDGLSNRPDHIYELKNIGYKAQLEAGIRIYSQSKLPVYMISGNHDAYYMKSAGADIVQALCEAVPNLNYLGNNQADIDIDGCTLRLFHGLDGNSYALSYRLQKLVESFSGGDKPHIVLCGHTHKFCYVFPRNVQAVSIPTLQMQTKFMQGKKNEAHMGWAIIDFETCSDGLVNFAVQYKPIYITNKNN